MGFLELNFLAYIMRILPKTGRINSKMRGKREKENKNKQQSHYLRKYCVITIINANDRNFNIK